MKLINKIVINQHYNDINPKECGKEICDPAHSYGPAVRSYYLLHFVVSGKGKFKCAGGEYELGKNDVFIIRPNEVTFYQADEKDPWTYIWIGFTARLHMPSVINSKNVIYAPFLSEIFYSCIKANDISQNGKGYEALLCSEIWKMIFELNERDGRSGEAVERYVRSALNIMEAEYPMGITVADIAERLHLNRSYFSQLFKEVTGRSPGAHLLSLRMERAAELLCRIGLNVSVTANSVGYSDVFTFSRAFKSYYGISPRDYVRTQRS